MTPSLRPALRVLAAFLAAVVALLFCAANALPAPDAPPPPDALFGLLLRAQAVSLPLLALPAALWAAAEGRARLRGLLAWPGGWGFRRLAWCLALALAGSYALAEGVAGGGEQEAARQLSALRPGQLLLFAPILVLAVPIFEEALFRGVLLHAAPPWAALPLSSLLFGLAHGPDAFALPLALLGWCLGLVTLRARSLLPAILLHALFNLLALILALL